MPRFWSNCLVWALARYWRHGGYFCVRRSRVWWGPHFLWMPREHAPLQSFVPEKNADARVGWRLHWLIWFRGYVKPDDQAAVKPMPEYVKPEHP